MEDIIVHCSFDEMVAIEKVIPNPKNPNKHPKKQIELLAKIIKSQGWRAPITLSKRSGFIVRGHGRLEAAQLLGMESVPVDWQDYESEATEYADLIADNRLSEIDNDLMADLLRDVDDEFTELTGYTDEEIAVLLAESPDVIEEDDYNAAEAYDSIKEPITQEGDIWILGNHRLLCGDSTRQSDAECLLGGDLADMCFTDPPYNVAYEGGTKDKLTIKNDSMSDVQFDDFLGQVYDVIYNALRPGAPVYVCHADSYGHLFRANFVQSGLLLKEVLVWVKNAMVLGRQDYQWKHEPILYGWKPGASHSWYGGRKQTTVIDENIPLEIVKDGDEFILNFSSDQGDVIVRVPDFEVEGSSGDELDTIWRFNKPLRNGEHPTMKPIELCARGIRNSSKQGDIVFEPFGGSGSTLIAAEQLDRRCYCIELDPKYCDVIVNRYIQFKGNDSDVSLERNGKLMKYKDVKNDV